MFGSAASKVSSSLPVPAVTAEQAGKAASGFSEAEALKHVKALAEFASHPAAASGHDLDSALQYVFKQGQTIKETAPEDVDVEVVPFPAESGDSNLKHVVIKVLPKNVSEANENSILVSAHIDTVFSAEGAGDDTSNVAVMLELARGISQTAHGFKNSVIFLFNTGEEEGLDGSHSFITQHPWSSTIRLAIDLEGLGIAGKSSTFQAVSHQASGFKNPVLFLFDQRKEEDGSPSSKTQNPPKKLVLDLEALGSTGGKSSKYNFQDLFSSGVINSATDFQIYKEIGGLSGLDFAYTDKGAVYHTKNDKLELLKSGSLQHLGEHMLPFLLQVASSPILS